MTDCPKCGACLALARERRNQVCIMCEDSMDEIRDEYKHPAKDYEIEDSFEEIPGSFTTEAIREDHEIVQSVLIPPRVFSEMKTYCDLAKGEISGLGKIEVKDGVARIVAIALLEQENTAAHTQISEETLNKFILNLAKKGQSPEMWKVWWHTHHNFQTFWSGVDTANISSLSEYMQSYLISVELNKAGSIIARLDENGVEYNLDLCMDKFKGYKKLRDKCTRKIKKLTKEVQPIITTNFYSYGYGRGYGRKYYE